MNRESEETESDRAIAYWRGQFGPSAQIVARLDHTGYDQVEIRATAGKARAEQQAFGWCLYDLSGADPVALTDPVRHLLDLTPAIARFVDAHAS